MTKRIVLFAALLIAPEIALAAQARADADPIIYAGVFMVQPDGTIGGSAAQTASRSGEDFKGVVYLGVCQYGARPNAINLPAAAIDAWQLFGKVVSLTSDEASVQITWQRIRRASADESSAPQSRTLTLKLGERTSLETASLPVGACGEGHASFDVAFGYRPGLVAELHTATAQQAQNLSVEMFMNFRAGPPGKVQLPADLWLVHSVAGRPDETFHVTSSLVSVSPANFAFPPLRIGTATGSMSVRVEGTFDINRAADRNLQLDFTAGRTLSFTPLRAVARDNVSRSERSTKVSVPLPTLGEVVSFELPPLRTSEGAVLPDRLDIRFQLNPLSGSSRIVSRKK